MRNLRKLLQYLGAGLMATALVGILGYYGYFGFLSYLNMRRAGDPAPTLTHQGRSYRDLNKNGRLDIYEDSRQPIDERIRDLLGQMTLEEKAGMMFLSPIVMNDDGSLMERPTPFNFFSLMTGTNSDPVLARLMNHFALIQVAKPGSMARWHNALQKLAERTRLGIPVTIASDPRHSFSDNPAANLFAGDFSQWPEPIGLAATDPGLVAQFADIARREYLAVGIRTALHPMADLATEPRWARISGTFGEDAVLASRMLAAYIRGFQGETLGPHSVACMTKHFPGGGPQKDGEDPHFPYGKEQVYPGDNFNYHLLPFETAFQANTALIMPYYAVPVGRTREDVGFAFNKEIITDLLRDHYGFDGVVCTDFGIISTPKILGLVRMFESMSWGVESLTPEQRTKKAIDAGVDQLGGEKSPELIVSLVNSGQLVESRIDLSVRRLLRDKFRLGLFDDPYVEAAQAERIVGNAEFRHAGELAQRKSIVLLKNGDDAAQPLLPLEGKPKIYIENIDPGTASRYGQVVANPADADFALLRLSTPFEPREGTFFESLFHQGDLDFKGQSKEHILAIADTVPTIVDIYLERPAVIPEIAQRSAALLANFGAQDAAVLDIIFGRFPPSGKLPFELPSSMDAVERQKEDLPYDSENPLFPFGFGLTFGGPEAADPGFEKGAGRQ